jgi:POT family proton-dependent oligopeptide transporter
MSEVPIEPGALSSSARRRTIPYDTDRMPPGVPFIIGNEAAERFSYYGMMAILAPFLTTHLLNLQGTPAPMTEHEANKVVHDFIFWVYAFPIVGALISDGFLGKYRTIISVSLLYCAGHAAMALVDLPRLTGIDPRTMLSVGLILIALGAGGIKPCVSANVGDQFGPRNKRLIEKVFSWFYFSINFGAAFSTLLTPMLLDKDMFNKNLGVFAEWLAGIGIRPGPSLAFGVPGVLMALATFIFWLGRNKFVHIPPGGPGFIKECFGPEGRKAALNLIPLFLLICVFFALFDQSHSSWIHQAEKMDRTLFAGTRFEATPSAAQFQAVNPILILIFIPIFSYVVYPLMRKFFAVTPLRKIAIGMFLTVPSFALIALAQERIDAKETPHISWQIGAYLVLTAAEVMVSITALEFSYTQAPRRMKSFVMGMYLLFGIAFGNWFASAVNKYIDEREKAGRPVVDPDHYATYFWFFTSAMLTMAIVFSIYAVFYRGQTFIQGEEEAAV